MKSIDTIPLRADLSYLMAPANAWWHWSADGRWIEWADGRSIAAREELLAVIERLSPRGLPPMGAVLLLLAATRLNWNSETATRLIVSSAATLDAGAPLAGILTDGVIQRRLQTDVADVCGDLAAIVVLPKHLKEPISAKAALADFVFERAASSVGPATADGIVSLFGEGFEANASVTESTIHPAKRVDLELAALRTGLARIQTESLETWLKTGLDSLIKPADLTVPMGRQVRALLSELREDRELGAFARITSQLLAVLHVPRVLRSPEELPLGGVSDISNRGSPERLLISELAHDSLTLAVRIAMNEALYLRREAPARHPPIARTVIIDGGIHMWGVPRVFGCAVAMALAATADPAGAGTVLRTRGRETEPVDFTSRRGLQGQLAHLTPWPDPADAIVRHLNASEAGRAASSELFAVVDRSTFEDTAFWRKVDPVLDRATFHLAVVSRTGEFELVLASRLGRRRIAAATLDLSKLLDSADPVRQKQALLDRDPSLPMILRLAQFPLRLPARVNAKFAVESPRAGLVGMTFDGRLMQWTSSNVGGRQLSDALPTGQFRGLFVDEDRQRIYAVLTRKKLTQLSMVIFDPESGHLDVKEFSSECPLAVTFHRGVLLLMQRKSFAVLHPDSGNLTRHELPSDAKWLSGRFYRTRNAAGWIAAAEGGSVEVHRSGVCFAAFDRTGSGPWSFGPQGRFFSADRNASVTIASDDLPAYARGPVKLASSSDGNRVLLNRQASSKRYEAVGVDLNFSTAKAFSDEQLAHAFLIGSAADWSLRTGLGTQHNFTEIAVTNAGQVILAHTGRQLALQCDAKGELRLNEIAKGAFATRRAFQLFGRRQRLPGTGLQLREARWADGSRAWLDSRGILHLKSDSPALPEISVAIGGTGVVGGWTSDGRTFGWRFFLGSDPTMSGVHAESLLRAFAERLT